MIGKAIYIFDRNHRVYRRDTNGHANGGPIWRDHWRESSVVGEKSRSWVTNRGTKIPKSGPLPHGVAWDTDQIDKLQWITDHSYAISSRISRGAMDYDTLKKIAALVGYES